MKRVKRHKQLSMILLALAILTRSSLAKTRPNIEVTAAPENKTIVEGSDLSFRFSVTNNSKQHSISFSTCPSPYEVALSDSQGRPVSQSDQYVRRNGVYVCESTVLIEIKPGETWGPQVWPAPDRGMFDLKAGTYTGRLLWHFTIYKKMSDGSPPALKNVGSITTPSNVFTFAVTPRP